MTTPTHTAGMWLLVYKKRPLLQTGAGVVLVSQVEEMARACWLSPVVLVEACACVPALADTRQVFAFHSYSW